MKFAWSGEEHWLMKSWLPVRACRYLILTRSAVVAIRHLLYAAVCRSLARYVAWQWSWTTMSPTLQEVAG